MIIVLEEHLINPHLILIHNLEFDSLAIAVVRLPAVKIVWSPHYDMGMPEFSE